MKEVFDAAVAVVSRLTEAGYTTYFAGGYVRDFLMGHPSDDIDIATTAPVEDIQRLFEKTIPVGIAFGIVIVVEQGHHFEVATFRTERGYEDGRRPTEVTPATPEEDALRRDFTINGMYYNPLTDELIDYVHGRKDLTKKIVRAIGDPDERFKEDRLRMIRAVRYAARFSFTIDPATWDAIAAHAHLLFPAVAIERVWNECLKMAKFSNFDSALCTLHRLGLLQTIFPELEHVPFEEIQQRTAPLRNCPETSPPILLILHLFPEHTREEQCALGRFLKVSNKDLNHIDAYHTFSKTLWKKERTPYETVRMLATDTAPIYLEIATASLKPSLRKELTASIETAQKTYQADIDRLKHKRPILTAQDLLATGLKPGPKIGELLVQAEILAINEQIHDKNTLLEKLGLSSN